MQRGTVLEHRTSITRHFETEGAGVLHFDDEFELQLSDTDGAHWKAFVFKGVVETPNGGRWVSAYGGDPIRPHEEHRRQWHSFDPDRVRTGAKTIRPTWSAKRAPR